ncbi:flagellar motor protein MotS [Amphibacillus xylanus]|uniref:Flagellar motor protein MotS n=1 Tax=Amphibacillus xylanus (strain ATCC 51415 / DSM 6626 / JCM 7361 / LMG 17667 / NBRC 15112 / Ep01) TaxID=698758 RepID=K0J713_AMPXN|nr:flagellar motor protein MotS [Amphibacillus xylanus]BAM47038.1 flagellar motor protein MotS [Amphibacillus xylanus NBRC 15112]
MKRRDKNTQEGGSAGWMTTYSDLVTLLLCFFVLLYSMSQLDIARFEAVAESFRNRVIFFDGSPSKIDFEQTGESATIREPNKDIEKDNILDPDRVTSNQRSLEELLNEVEGFLEENQLRDVISANRTDQGVVLILQERILFDSGQAELKPDGLPFLDKISLLLSKIPNYVRVEGHTDNRPISTVQYPSNWELSGARASSVIRHILDSGEFNPSRFIAAGYGDTRPIVPNTSSENWQKNRRVEIVILELSEGQN